MVMMMKEARLFLLLMIAAVSVGIGGDSVKTDEKSKSDGPTQKIVVAGGCFWCLEAVFQRLPGVKKVVSGYAGGTVANPTYEQVCSESTGHAESVEIEFDPTKATVDVVLDVFFAAHDPTTLDRQGNDVGRQYRSAIFYANDSNGEQKRVAEAYIRQLNDARIFTSAIVTTVDPLEEFFEAEAYHQNYAALNPNQPYIAYVATPKVDKLREYFPDKL